jgi:nicotinamide-nucleotide amidase
MVSPVLIDTIGKKLTDKHLSIATAESCTGGLLGHVLTSISGSSAYYDRGIISYTNQAKQDLLDVSEELLIKYGAVSEQVARAMAEGVRKLANTTIGVSTTGIAGPTGGTKDKPVGLVYIGLSTEKKTVVNRFVFDGNRLENKESTCVEALKLVQQVIDKQGL